MGNGEQSTQILIDDADRILAQESKMDFSKCGVHPSIPQSSLLNLRINRAQLVHSLEDEKERHGGKFSFRGLKVSVDSVRDLGRCIQAIAFLAIAYGLLYALGVLPGWMILHDHEKTETVRAAIAERIAP